MPPLGLDTEEDDQDQDMTGWGTGDESLRSLYFFTYEAFSVDEGGLNC